MLSVGRAGARLCRLRRPIFVHIPPCASRGLATAIPQELDLSLVKVVSEVTNVSTEPSLASLGLGGWTPPGVVQSMLEYMHVSHSLPWWGSIAVGTVLVRAMIFPLVVKMRRDTANMHNHMPAMMHLQNAFSAARSSGDELESRKAAAELVNFINEKKVNPLKNFIAPLAQMPFFVSFFFGLREMAALPVESLKSGGALWFADLTVADPLLGLPILTSLTLLVTIELGGDVKAPTKGFHNFLRVIPFAMLPFTAQFPAALLCYWTCNNLITLVQVGVMRRPAVQKYFGIPELVKHPETASAPSMTFTQAWSNVKKSQAFKERKSYEEIRAEIEEKLRNEQKEKESKQS